MEWDTASRHRNRRGPNWRNWLPARSLAWKLTLAFILVGLMGAVLVAVLTSQRTRSEFDRFRTERDREFVLEVLSEYYEQHGSWSGLSATVQTAPQLRAATRDLVVADAQGKVVLGNRAYGEGQQLPREALAASVQVREERQTVGYVLPDMPFTRRTTRSLPPDTAFLQRVGWAAAVSASVASVLALVLGALLARTLTRPIRELTAATKAMASGNLGQRVHVRSHDEIGELASSFNQMSADLARASHVRKQMTADLAHDLRTPLSILRGYTEGLKDARLQGSPQLYALMFGEVEHLQRLVEDLRVLSLADAGELPLNRRAVDPSALIERTALAYVVQAEEQGVTLRVERDEQLPSIAVDTDRITQVLNNLVSNALRHTPSGEIVLSAQAEDGQVRLSIRDTGVGIAADDLPFIFDRFYRADKARQRSDNASSGLGLAIAKAIVEAHGGTISASSTPGQGTTFVMRFPVAPPPAEQGTHDGTRVRTGPAVEARMRQ